MCGEGTRSPVVLGVALLGLAAPIHGQAPVWAVRAEAGWVNERGSPDPGPLLGVAAQRRFGSSGVVGLEAAVALATADEGLAGFSVGPEVRLLPGKPLSPFAAARVGGALEESELGWLAETRVGVVYRWKGTLGVTARGGAPRHRKGYARRLEGAYEPGTPTPRKRTDRTSESASEATNRTWASPRRSAPPPVAPTPRRPPGPARRAS